MELNGPVVNDYWKTSGIASFVCVVNFSIGTHTYRISHTQDLN